MSYTERLARLVYWGLNGLIVLLVLGWFVRLAAVSFAISGSNDLPQRHLADDIAAWQAAHPDATHQLTPAQLDQMRDAYKNR